MENRVKQKKSAELLSVLVMAENWAAIKTLWQDGIWHDVFSPSLSMVQAYIKIKTKPMCILHNVTANVWNKVR